MEEEIGGELPDMKPGEDTVGHKPEEIGVRAADNASEKKRSDVGYQKDFNSRGKAHEW